MLGERYSSVVLERWASRLTHLLTPRVGATAARFYAERITQALLEGGDVVEVTSALLPLPPGERRKTAVQLATAWVGLSAGR